MKKKILWITLILLIVVALGAYWWIGHIKKSGLPDYNADISLPGLRDKVTVYRDSLGVPHIVASNEHDVYLVTGYLEAQDRMWQMDLVRRVTQGRLSEIFGEKALDADRLLRKLQIPATSEKWMKNMPPEILERLQWYADGVNVYIRLNRDRLPMEFRILGYRPEPWTPRNSVNLVGYMSWMLELGYKAEALASGIKDKLGDPYLKDFLPDWKRHSETVYRDYIHDTVTVRPDTTLTQAMAFIRQWAPALTFGSNNWAVAGKKSVTGKPLFSNDMHLHLGLPGIWWRAQQVVPGKLDVTGVLLPGSPFVVAGHNQNIAWGMTNVMLDGSDFYKEKIDTARKAYFFEGQWRKLKVVKEKIKIKGGKIYTDVQYYTHRGPVLTKLGDTKVTPVSMRWIGNDEDHAIEALYGFNKAKNWTEFRKAARGFMAVSQNIAYADIHGNIGIQCTGHVPVRTAPGYFFYPGQTGRYDWKGFVPFDQLPYEYNPERGYISSANNKTFPDSLYISQWYDLPYRIRRIREMLESKPQLGPGDFRRMLYDHQSVRARSFLPVLNHTLARFKWQTGARQKAAALLAGWDGTYETDSKAPPIFDEFLRQFLRNVTQDELGDELFPAFYASFLMNKYLLDNIFNDTTSVWLDDIHTGRKETFSDMVRLSFVQAVDTVESKYGKIGEVTWGDIHRLHLAHPMGKVKLLDKIFGLNRDYPAPGSSNTVSPFSYIVARPYDSDFGASEKHIYNTADWDASYSILPGGESGMPASPHYADQAKAYVEGRIFHDRYSKAQIIKNARYKATFYPAK